MGLEYYFEKAVIGINGGWFYFSYYGGVGRQSVWMSAFMIWQRE